VTLTLQGSRAEAQSWEARQEEAHREVRQEGSPQCTWSATCRPGSGGQVGPVPYSNGSMRGHPPEILDGRRESAVNFMREFRLWRICNLRNEASANPVQRTALALSYIEGSNVDDWVAQQSDKVGRKVYSDPNVQLPVPPIYADADERIWNEFVGNSKERLRKRPQQSGLTPSSRS